MGYWMGDDSRTRWIGSCAQRLALLRPRLELKQTRMLAEDLWAAYRNLLAPDEAARMLADGTVEV